jgi:hypothetical protein
MPLGPGAELLEVELRQAEISRAVTGPWERTGKGAGSEGWEEGTGGGFGGKKRVERAVAIVGGWWVRVPS